MNEPSSQGSDDFLTPPERSELSVDFQWECVRDPSMPGETALVQWASAALVKVGRTAEVTIRIVDKSEIAQLNQQWRQKDGPTNVLSFPADFPPEAGLNYLGDILVCADVLAEESREQRKSLEAHWAHIIVHGMLHLQGYDHVDDIEATEMESLEADILHSMGYSNPYEPPIPES